MSVVLQLVIFDCDGVLFDSAEANIAYYNAVLGRVGLPPLTAEWEHRVHYLASSQVWDDLFGAGSALARQARRAASEIDYGPFFPFMRPVAELEETLATLKRHYHLAMATNRGSTVAEIMHRFGLNRFLDLAVGIRDVERPKPHPDMLEKCLAHFAVAPTESVYIGDAESDRDAARAAGMHFLAVGDPPWAANRVRHLREVPQRLLQLAREPDSAGTSCPPH